jgi:hypothetical protein
MRSFFARLRSALTSFGAMVSGDDLRYAREQSPDEHEHKPNLGPLFPG